MALRESKDAKEFKKLKRDQKLIVKDTVAATKEDMFKRGRVKHKMSMIHTTDWFPGKVLESYRQNHPNIFGETDIFKNIAKD